jgi:1-aminocyclopropane-1-carboxylate deaminase/D-cysteine desulfhydrase-like pyridoxal-dependent ACC family enzyme
MFKTDESPIIQEIKPRQNPNNVRLFVKREDLLHPVISGNKWRKLKYNIMAAREANETTLLTFGGAYSNHIHAVAGAAQDYGFESIGIIRGEEHLPLNPTLQEAEQMGMRLHYLDRTTYRQKDTNDVIERLREEQGGFYLIPEGGTNELALKGAAEIVENIETDYDYFCVACGTGGTAAGIITGLDGKSTTIGFSVLKGDFHQEEIKNWLRITNHEGLSKWSINTNCHFGGYAKFDQRLIEFINKFKAAYDIQLDPIYTGKLFYGLIEMISAGKFPLNSRVLAIHTGGLQGIKGFNQRFNNIINCQE